jgi:hypothetical protein
MAGDKTFPAGFHLLEGLVNNDDVVLMGLKKFNGLRWRSRYLRLQVVLLLDRRRALLCPRRRANRWNTGLTRMILCLPPGAK